MSKKVPEEKYEKSLSYKLKQWFEGTKDPFLDTVEMKPQKEFSEDKATLKKRAEERKKLKERIYDTRHNSEVLVFTKFYRVASVLFCICLVAMLRPLYRKRLTGDGSGQHCNRNDSGLSCV